jgi:hypothetical protein
MKTLDWWLFRIGGVIIVVVLWLLGAFIGQSFGDDRGNPLESWRCGKVVVNYNQLRSDAYEWEFVGELPAKGRLSFVYEDHGNSVDLNGEGCDRIKKKGEAK